MGPDGPRAGRELTIGLALMCDTDGRIGKVLHDSLQVYGSQPPGSHWTSALDSGSLEKAETFQSELGGGEAVFDWELNAWSAGAVVPLRFAGIRDGDSLLILAARTGDGLNRLVDEMMAIGNEQGKALRRAAKDNAALSGRLGSESFLFEEISRLNNELVTAQRRLAKQNKELETLNEMKNRFLGMAAHDLRNPLGNIHIITEILEDESRLTPEERRYYLGQIRTTSEFTLRLVEDLLDVSVIESGKIDLRLSEIDLGELIRRCIGFCKALSDRKRIRIEFVGSDACPLVLDAMKVEQVLINLITNAIKYSPKDTLIEVDLASAVTEVRVSVRDRGLGIAAEELGLLFRPFQRTKTKATDGEKSVGLGLYISKRIVEGHGGRIWAASAKGEGSTFSFSLPKPST